MTSDQAQAPSATVTKPSDREIRTERVFDAPRDRVWAVYTDPALIPEWWGPRGVTTVVDKMDMRVGGDWRFVDAEPTAASPGSAAPTARSPRPSASCRRSSGRACPATC